MKHLSVKVGNPLGAALGGVGSDTSATIAMLIIGFHAAGFDISQFRADAYRALATEGLDSGVATRLQQIINGVTPLDHGLHTPVPQPSHQRVTFESEPKTAEEPVFTPEPEDEEDDFDFGMHV